MCDKRFDQKQNKPVESAVMQTALVMAQQSCSPNEYECFVKAYNCIIKNRHLSLDKIG